jgi:hypothetical protein
MKRCEIEYGRPPGPKNKHGRLLAGFAAQALSLDSLAKLSKYDSHFCGLTWISTGNVSVHNVKVMDCGLLEAFVFFVRDSVL